MVIHFLLTSKRTSTNHTVTHFERNSVTTFVHIYRYANSFIITTVVSMLTINHIIILHNFFLSAWHLWLIKLNGPRWYLISQPMCGLSFASSNVFCLNLHAPHSVVFRKQKPCTSERPCYLVTAFYSQPELAGTTSFLTYIPNPIVKAFPDRCAIIALSLGLLSRSAGAFTWGSYFLLTSDTNW